MTDVVADAVEDIADTIETHGWVQNQPGDRVQGFCITGAAAHRLQLDDDLRNRALCAIAKGLPPLKAPYQVLGCECNACTGKEPGFVIVAWNDGEGRTEQEVLDHLRLAAKRERT